MYKINILGTGNVGTALSEAFKDNANVKLISSRSPELIDTTADFTIIAVSDNAIEEVAYKLPKSSSIVCHTSGSIPLSVLQGLNNATGVFYPLQTFTKGIKLDYSLIPFFIEASESETIEQLQKLASLISHNIYISDSEKRKNLHLASVFACNFTNALAYIADQCLDSTGYDFSVLQPLLEQTVAKLCLLTPEEAQTGPAIRNDTKVIDAHLKMLDSMPLYQQIYKLLTQSICDQKKMK